MKVFRKLLLFFTACFLLFACGDEAVKFDPRTQAEGDYKYYLTMYTDDSMGKLTPLGSAYDINGSFQVSKDESNESGLIIKEDAQVAFKLNNIVEIFNGFSLEVPSQSFKNNGQSYPIAGFKGASVASTTGTTVYQGYYNTNSHLLEFWFQYTLNGTTIVCQVLNIKK